VFVNKLLVCRWNKLFKEMYSAEHYLGAGALMEWYARIGRSRLLPTGYKLASLNSLPATSCVVQLPVRCSLTNVFEL
jgi:hypothetical protein